MKDQKKMPIKRAGELGGAPSGSCGTPQTSQPFGGGGAQGGCPFVSPADILKKVIREYRDVYPEIIAQAGRTLQEVGGGGTCTCLGVRGAVSWRVGGDPLPADLTLCFLQVFGLRLVEIDAKHHLYILVSDLPRAEGENLHK